MTKMFCSNLSCILRTYLFIDPPDSKPESGLSSNFSILFFLRDRLRIMFSIGEAILFILYL